MTTCTHEQASHSGSETPCYKFMLLHASLHLSVCVCVVLLHGCFWVWQSVLLSAPCLTRLKQKQGHCWGWRTYGWMSHTFLAWRSTVRTGEQHHYVPEIWESTNFQMFLWFRGFSTNMKHRDSFFKLLLSDHLQYVYTDVPYSWTGLH